MIVSVDTVRRLSQNIEELKADLQSRENMLRQSIELNDAYREEAGLWEKRVEELKIELQEAIEQRDMWKKHCESALETAQALVMSREEWWQAAWR